MKKRHEQKLVVLSIALIALFNIPLVMIFSQDGNILGFPTLYFFIFLVWTVAIGISYIILSRYHE